MYVIGIELRRSDMKQLDYNYIPKKSGFISKLLKKHQLKKRGIIKK